VAASFASATNASTTPSQVYAYSYDRFGNRWQQNYTQGPGAPSSVSFSFDGDNRLSTEGYIYDAAGNLVMDNLNCYTYDAENRLVSVAPETTPGSDVCGATTMSYLYGPDGRRVARVQGGAVVKQYYYDAAGHMITEANASGATLRAEIYAGERHLATWANNATYFNHADWLGTERARSLGSGPSAGQRCEKITSLPFGDGMVTQQDNGGCGDPSPSHFTGKERDSESGLDYFGARYNASSLGRFVSPDWSAKPVGIPYADLANPQSINLYSYVVNNPLSHTDPNGHDWFYINKKWQWQAGHVFKGPKGNVLSKNGYEYLLVFNKSGVNRFGATVGSLTLYDQNKAIASVTGAFSGGADREHPRIPNGAFMIRLDIRGTAGPKDVIAGPGGLPALAPFYGAQDIPPLIHLTSPSGDADVDMRWEWGTRRIALNPMPGYSGQEYEGNYLHGKDRPGDYTHNCICDRSEHMLDVLYKLGDVGVPTQVQ
jgi:RHS repeat-associated protein